MEGEPRDRERKEEGEENEIKNKGNMMCHIHVTSPCEEHDHYILPTCTKI